MSNEVYVITGGSGGMGKATAELVGSISRQKKMWKNWLKKRRNLAH